MKAAACAAAKAVDARIMSLPSGPGPMVRATDPEGGEMAGSEHAEELLQIEEADAWFEYLESTRAQSRSRRARTAGSSTRTLSAV